MFGNEGHDLDVMGNKDLFKLLNRISCRKGGWTKRAKALEIPGVGVVVHMSTLSKRGHSETATFVPGVKVVDNVDGSKRLVKVGEEPDAITKMIIGDRDWDVMIEDDCIVIRRNHHLDTIIELNRIKNEADLFRWVISVLHEKDMSTEIVCEFISTINRVKGFELPDRF